MKVVVYIRKNYSLRCKTGLTMENIVIYTLILKHFFAVVTYKNMIMLLYFYKMTELCCVWYPIEEVESDVINWESWLPESFHVFILFFL